MRRGCTEGICDRAASVCLIVVRNPSGVCRPIGMRPASCARQRTRLRLCRAYSVVVRAYCCLRVSAGGLAPQWSSIQQSSSCRTILLSTGEANPPWGVPEYVGWKLPSSITPAWSIWRIRSMNRSSLMRLRKQFKMTPCGMESKHLTRSPSMVPRSAQRDGTSSESAEKYAFLKRKNKRIPHKGGICEQYHEFDGHHPDLFALGSLNAFVVWRSRAD